MGITAKMTNTRTGQSVTMVAAGSTRPLLEIYVGDTVRLDYTLKNDVGYSAYYQAVWTTGEGDKTSSSVALSPGATASGSLSHTYAAARSQTTISAYALAGGSKIDGIVYADIVIKTSPAKFRIDDIPIHV